MVLSSSLGEFSGYRMYQIQSYIIYSMITIHQEIIREDEACKLWRKLGLNLLDDEAPLFT
jgi:hypothetical protein